MAKRTRVHVTPRKDGWAVKTEGSKRASKVEPTQAKPARGQVLVHGRNNRIREERTCGKDPFPPRG